MSLKSNQGVIELSSGEFEYAPLLFESPVTSCTHHLASMHSLLARRKLISLSSIRAAYLRLLRDDPDVTMPVAAIGALVELLAQTEMSTVSGTRQRTLIVLKQLVKSC